MSAAMNKVGVVGWPVDQSVSPAMFNAAFAALGMHDWFYDRIAIPPEILALSLRELSDHGYIGVNITVPHKEAALALVKADPLARDVGAVNTIVFRRKAGTNTDVAGFIDDLRAHDVTVKGERVLILGAGGAARAAAYGLLQEGVGALGFACRTAERALKIGQDFHFEPTILPVGEAGTFAPSLIVNCTPLGMMPNVETSPWPDETPFPRGITVYDMVYRPAPTRFVRQAEAAGIRAIGGLGMLVRQGAASFRYWTGVEPPVEVMREAAQKALGL
jgi:shikimate dehydrogenase